MLTHLDHVYSYLKDNDLEKTLNRFEKAGFLINPKKMSHSLGRFNGFVSLTGTYLEFISIVDEVKFSTGADQVNKILRMAPHPFGVGAVSLDPHLIFDKLSPIYPNLKPPYSAGSADKPKDILWTFCSLPYNATPGAYVFPLKYHKREKDEYEVKKGPNSIFGIGGFYFCSDSPQERMDIWSQTFSKITPNFMRQGSEISFGCQTLRWMTRTDRERIFGEMGWDRRTFLGAEICGVRLLAESLAQAWECLERGEFQVSESSELNALIVSDANSAFTFVIEEGNSAKFCENLNTLRKT